MIAMIPRYVGESFEREICLPAPFEMVCFCVCMVPILMNYCHFDQ